MATTSKQDRQGARTPADLEYKYNFGKTFAEIMGIATDARNTAEMAAELDEKLTQEEIFNRLTNNGEAQGVFRGDDGQIYINAAYIVALSELFAKNITMTGTLTNTLEAFIEPSDEEILTIQRHVLGIETIIPSRIPLYDFSGDGKVTSLDASIAQKAKLGIASLESWSGAVKTPVTLTINLNDPEKAIRIIGTNMWGREIDEHIGVNGVTMRHTGTADYVVEEGVAVVGFDSWKYRKWNSGKAECWCQKIVDCAFSNQWGSLYVADNHTGQIAYPFEFVTAPTEIVTAKNSVAALFVYADGGLGVNTTTKTGVYRVARPTAADIGTTQVEYSFYVVGNWR